MFKVPQRQVAQLWVPREQLRQARAVAVHYQSSKLVESQAAQVKRLFHLGKVQQLEVLI